MAFCGGENHDPPELDHFSIYPFQIYPCPRETALFCDLLLVESSNKMVISGDLQPNNL
jgi:hypothetical protein